MANFEDFEVFGGEDRVLTLHARDPSNAVVNLTGLTIAWRVGSPPQDIDMRGAIIDAVGTIVSASAGTFTVPLANADTLDLYGNYLHQALTTDSNGSIKVVTQGMLKIRRLMDN